MQTVTGSKEIFFGGKKSSGEILPFSQNAGQSVCLSLRVCACGCVCPCVSSSLSSRLTVCHCAAIGVCVSHFIAQGSASGHP